MDENSRHEIESRLDANLDWYISNQSELVKEYNGKYLLIVDCAVVGSYADDSEALHEGRMRYGLGNFSIQRCSPGDVDWSIYYPGPFFSNQSLVGDSRSGYLRVNNPSDIWKQKRSRQDRIAAWHTRWRTYAS